LGVPFILIGGVKNYDTVEGTGAVTPCRLYIESVVVRQMKSLAVVFNVVFSYWRCGSPEQQKRQWE